MDSSWWTLPGPRRFLDNVVRDLRDGKNVVLCLPQHLPDGIARAVRNGVGDDWDWVTISIDNSDVRSPMIQLYDQFIPWDNEELGPIRNISTLVSEPAFTERIVWIEGLSDDTWPTWSSFLVEYQHACRAQDPVMRTLFCVPLSGAPALTPPGEDVCLTQHRWDGVVDQLDMMLFCAEIIRDRSLSPVRRQLAVETATHLALWDPEVSVRLLDEHISRILSPGPVLSDLAEQRGWVDLDCSDLNHIWQSGIGSRFEGKHCLHSAVMFVGGDPVADSEVQRRLWSAQVGVMLPFVEERRRHIIEQFSEVFRLPHYPPQDQREPIREARDLEIGHIFYQVEYMHVELGTTVREHVRSLKQIRDRLAHLQILDTDALWNDSLLDLPTH